MTRTLAVLLVLLPACAAPADTGPDGSPDTDTASPHSGSDPEWHAEWFEPEFLSLWASFGIDADGQPTAVTFEGRTLTPGLRIDLVERSGYACTLVFAVEGDAFAVADADGDALARWLDTHGLWTGFAVTPGAYTLTVEPSAPGLDCTLDPAVWGDTPDETLLAGAPLFVGVGGAPSDTVVEAWEDLASDIALSDVDGGRMQLPADVFGEANADHDPLATVAYAVDEAGAPIVQDGMLDILAPEARWQETPRQLAAGWYVLTSVVMFQLD